MRSDYEHFAAALDADAGIGTDTARNVLNDGVVLVCGGNLTPQPITWLWDLGKQLTSL